MLLRHFLSRFLLLTAFGSSIGCAATSEDVEADEATVSETSELSGAGIVPQVSIRGVELGMTMSQVRGLLGTAEHIVKYDDSSRIRWFEYVKTRTKVYFDQDTQRVRYISLSSATPRTKEGVGIGSYRSAVDALPGSMCFASRESDVDDFGDEIVFFIQKCEIVSGTTKTSFYFPTTPTVRKDPNAKVSIIALEKFK